MGFGTSGRHTWNLLHRRTISAKEFVRKNKKAAAWQQRPWFAKNLFGLLANLFSGTLSGQRFLHPSFRARLQVEGVTLYFLNDVFCLNLALEPAQGVLDRLAFLQSNFCQSHHPQPSTMLDSLKLILFVPINGRATQQVCRITANHSRETCRDSLNGRPEWTRTIDLFRVKEAL